MLTAFANAASSPALPPPSELSDHLSPFIPQTPPRRPRDASADRGKRQCGRTCGNRSCTFVSDGFIYEAVKTGITSNTLQKMNPEQKRLRLGAAIRDRREAQGLSQHKLALMVGSSKSHIWRIESGRVSVGLDDLGRIADALDIEVRQLFTF